MTINKNAMKNLFKIFFLCVAVAFCAACDGEQGAGGSTELPSLQMTVDKAVVQANSDDYVTVTVTGKNGVIKDGLVYVDKKTNKTLQIEDGKFYPKKAGEYEFMASDGNGISNYVKVAAIDFPVPALPQEDEADADKLDFNKRVMIVQFTSTGCTGCPGMKSVLKAIAADDDYNKKFVIASSHHEMGVEGYSDPAVYEGGDAYADKVMNGQVSYPTLILDYAYSYADYRNLSNLEETIDKLYGTGLAPVGISVNSNGASSAVVARVCVKVAAETTSAWRIGAFLLQDGIVAPQKNAPDTSYNTHNDCIRAMDCNPNATYYGHSLGRIDVGETADYTFVFNKFPSNVKINDCKLLIYVTCNNVVQNAIVAPIGENVGYDYAL